MLIYLISSTPPINVLILFNGSFEVDDPTRFGVLEVDKDDKVVQFVEKPKDRSYGNKISLGLYHLYKKDIFGIQNNLEIPCSFERQVFPALSKTGLLSTYTVKGDMLDVGTLESYISAHIVKGEDNWISPNNVEISKSAIIKNSVILDNCIKDNAPSCILAPPLVEKQINGVLFSIACSMP